MHLLLIDNKQVKIMTPSINKQDLQRPEMLQRAYALRKLEETAREYTHSVGGLPGPHEGRLIDLQREIQNKVGQPVVLSERVKQAAYLLGYNDSYYLQWFDKGLDPKVYVREIALVDGISGISDLTFQSDILRRIPPSAQVHERKWSPRRIESCPPYVRGAYRSYIERAYLLEAVNQAFWELHWERKLVMETGFPTPYDRFTKATEQGWVGLVMDDILNKVAKRRQSQS